MSYPWCEKCGSRNHRTYDCSKPGRYTPTAADFAELQPTVSSPVAVRAPEAPQPMFEPKQRFKGCPPICTAANLPSFEDEKKLERWHSQFSGSYIKKKWLCEKCNQWHYTTGLLELDSVIPVYCKNFRRKTYESRMPADELPCRELPPKEETKKVEKKVETKPKKKPQSLTQNEQSLF